MILLAQGGSPCGLHDFFLYFNKTTNQPPPNSDAFAGGLVAGIVEGKTIDEQVDQGHWLARLSIQEPGPQYVTFLPLRSRKLQTYIFEHLDIKKKKFPHHMHSGHTPKIPPDYLSPIPRISPQTVAMLSLRSRFLRIAFTQDGTDLPTLDTPSLHKPSNPPPPHPPSTALYSTRKIGVSGFNNFKSARRI